jgi:hypothetical protein
VSFPSVGAQAVATLLEQRVAAGGWRNRYWGRLGYRRGLGFRRRREYRRRLGRLLHRVRDRWRHGWRRRIFGGLRRKRLRGRRLEQVLSRLGGELCAAAFARFPVSLALLLGAFVWRI